MIRNHEHFEAALDEATELLQQPPAEGAPGHARLLALMHDIAAYSPTVRVETPREDSELERLSRRLDAFEAHLAPHFSSHWHSMIGGSFGAGD